MRPHAVHAGDGSGPARTGPRTCRTAGTGPEAAQVPAKAARRKDERHLLPHMLVLLPPVAVLPVQPVEDGQPMQQGASVPVQPVADSQRPSASPPPRQSSRPPSRLPCPPLAPLMPRQPTARLAPCRAPDWQPPRPARRDTHTATAQDDNYVRRSNSASMPVVPDRRRCLAWFASSSTMVSSSITARAVRTAV